MTIGLGQISDVSYIRRGNSFDIVVTDNEGVRKYADLMQVHIHSNMTSTHINPTSGAWMRYKDTREYNRDDINDSILQDSSWLVWTPTLYHRLYSSNTRSYVLKLPITLDTDSYIGIRVQAENGFELEAITVGPRGRNYFNYSKPRDFRGEQQCYFIAQSDTTEIWLWMCGSRFVIYELTVKTQNSPAAPPYGTELSRPTNSFIGHQYYCTDTNKLTMYDGSEWKIIKEF